MHATVAHMKILKNALLLMFEYLSLTQSKIKYLLRY